MHLEETVIPKVPLRQWVCTLPWRLRVLLGYDRKLCTDVLSAFVHELMRSLKRRAKRVHGLASVDDAHPGAVTFIQRFDSGLRLNVHFHVLALDGVYVTETDSARPVFLALPPPTADEVAEVTERTANRVAVVLVKHGRFVDEEHDAKSEKFAEDEPLLATCYGAAAQGLDVDGPRAGQPTLRLINSESTRATEAVAIFNGFNVHAQVAFDGRDRPRLERMCRYLARPPIAQERLERMSDGRLRFTMKRPWRDGTFALLFEPLDLIARICAMIPAPGFHMTRFHGILAPNAKLRPLIVPRPPAAGPSDDAVQLGLFQDLAAGDADNDSDAEEPRRKPWAWLLRHVWKIDVTTCVRCGGNVRWLEAATESEDIARLLARDRSTGPPRPSTRRQPPGQLRLGFEA